MELGQNVDVENKLRVLKEVDELIIVVGKNTIVQDNQINKLPSTVKVYQVTDYLRWLRSNYNSNIYGNNHTDRNKRKTGLNSENKAGKKRKI